MKSENNIENTQAGSDYPATCSSLFIGGIMDGKWKPDLGYNIIQCAVPGPIPIFNLPGPHEYSVRTETYRRERIRAEKEEWSIYVLDSLRIDQAMSKLIRGYSPHNAERTCVDGTHWSSGTSGAITGSRKKLCRWGRNG